MVRELTAQDAKDIAYKHQDNEEIYTLAKNLENTLDGTWAHENKRIERLEDECDDLQNEVDRAESQLEECKQGFKNFLDDILDDLNEKDFDKESLIKKINEFEV